MATHCMTGATGFVGSAIALELLRDPEARVVGIVRPMPERAPTARLKELLHSLVPAYALPEALHAAIEARVSAVAGDVGEPLCGVDVDGLQGCELWHCAASLQYQDRHQALIDRTNVDGTRNTVALAQHLGVRRLNMVSTAYVAGRRTGRILPTAAEHGVSNNHYERSKVEAEQIVARSGLPARTLRPGIVIGHSQTRYALNYNGLYGFLRGLTKLRSSLDRTQPGLARRLQLKLRADAGGRLGLVPVDHVAQEAAALSRRDAAPGIYHLTNPTPPPTGLTMAVTFDVAGLHAPQLVDDAEPLGAIDEKLRQGVDFYNSYLVWPKHFDRAATDAALGDERAPGLELNPERLTAFCTWYADQLEAERAALPVQR
jgi:thioester reductase-like protein